MEHTDDSYHKCSHGVEKKFDQCICDQRLRKFFYNNVYINSNLVTFSQEGLFNNDDQQLRIYNNCPLQVNLSSLRPNCPDSLCAKTQAL